MEYTFNDLSLESIDEIREAWERLNEEHQERSRYFKKFYANRTFEERFSIYRDYAPDDVFIEVVKNRKQEVIGYCISAIRNGLGEIDSLYVDERSREHGIGSNLMINALKWLKANGSDQIGLAVSQGNEQVFDFYQRFNFFPRKTYLMHKNPMED
ncbi:GNAT family N-acetyltransferase [Fusibacter paucivorans]|uniref:GNAT family N-acetyltransferase n=1 Tax=Fusibacter paucivorans TaxID=76009 RepID=A0ABS5PLH4_9FIRM|nr:GNAT family N-acetyltransferase [Fusibacter paucivorans]MBS7525918.1 GNAT family N-acetyltransferase [Fusibacter paucivorans]